MLTRSHAFGLLVAALLAAAAYLLTAVPAFHLVSPMLFAVLLGLVARNLGALPTGTDAGLKYASKTLLRAGVVLLGLRLSLPDVLSLGSGALLVLLITVGGCHLRRCPGTGQVVAPCPHRDRPDWHRHRDLRGVRRGGYVCGGSRGKAPARSSR